MRTCVGNAKCPCGITFHINQPCINAHTLTAGVRDDTFVHNKYIRIMLCDARFSADFSADHTTRRVNVYTYIYTYIQCYETTGSVQI